MPLNLSPLLGPGKLHAVNFQGLNSGELGGDHAAVGGWEEQAIGEIFNN